MELIEIVPTTTVEEALRAYRSAKVGRFQRYHFGGCKNGSHTPTERLVELHRNWLRE